MVYKVVLAFDSVHEIPRKCDNSNAPVVQFTFLNLVPRALFPGFGGGAPPPKPGKSALGTRLHISVQVGNRYRIQHFYWKFGATYK